MTSGPFKPAFAGNVLPVGCSDKNTRWHLLRGDVSDEPKLTTYGRATAAIEQYWAGRAAQNAAAHTASAVLLQVGTSPVGSPTKLGTNLPGGETALARKTREACWKDSVQLAQQPGRYIPPWQGVPADIEEKEAVRTRGIPGFTGKQPPPGLSRPPPEPPNTSGYVAINAFDERRPRLKGIPGYTGHQPPSPHAGPASIEPYDHEDQYYDHNTHMWVTPMPQQTAVEAAAAAAAADERYYRHHQQHLYPDIPQPAAGVVAAPATAEQAYMSEANQLRAYDPQQHTSPTSAAAATPVARKLEYSAQYAHPPVVESHEPAVWPSYDGPQAAHVHMPASAAPSSQPAYNAVTDGGQALAYSQVYPAAAPAAAACDAGETYGFLSPSAVVAGRPAAGAAGCHPVNGMDGGAFRYAPGPTAAAGQSAAAHHASAGVAVGPYGQPVLQAAGDVAQGTYDPNMVAAALPCNMYPAATDQQQQAQHNAYTVYPSAAKTAAKADGCKGLGTASCSDWHQHLHPQQQLAGRAPIEDYTCSGSLSAQPSSTTPASVHGVQNVVQRPSAFSVLPRTRQTTYAATYTPPAGFGQLLQQKMNGLQPFSPGGIVACVPRRL